MRKIKVKNFEPIKEGYSEEDEFIEIRKVTVLTGNQANSKNPVA